METNARASASLETVKNASSEKDDAQKRVFTVSSSSLEFEPAIDSSSDWLRNSSEEVALEGEMWSWGAGTDGQLATGRLEDNHSPQLLRLAFSSSHGRITSLACGGAHVIALTSCGKVLSWGRGSSGQLGHGDINAANCSHPKPVEGLYNFFISYASAGWNHSGFVSDSGRVFSCGDGSFGQLGHGDYQSYNVPTEIPYFSSKHAVQIACGMRHTLVLLQGNQTYGFGFGKRGQLGISLDKIKSVGLPQECLNLEKVEIASLSANGDHSAALTADGHLYAWGRGFSGASDASVPQKFSSSLSFKQAAFGWNHALLLTCEGEVFMLGGDLHGRMISDPQKTSPSQNPYESTGLQMYKVAGLDGIRTFQIAAGAEHSALLTENREIRTWGWGEHGQLGLGDTLDRSGPQTVNLGNKPTQSSLSSSVYCGSGFTFVLRRMASLSSCSDSMTL